MSQLVYVSSPHHSAQGLAYSIASSARASSVAPRRDQAPSLDHQIDLVSLTIRLSSAVCRESGPRGRFACV